MILGGAIGNILDRIRHGFVVDLADLHFGTFRPFLIFNVADACIKLGVLLLVARALLLREKAPAAGSASDDAPATRSEETTSELQALMRTPYALFVLQNKYHTRLKQINT